MFSDSGTPLHRSVTNILSFQIDHHLFGKRRNQLELNQLSVAVEGAAGNVLSHLIKELFTVSRDVSGANLADRADSGNVTE